MTYRELRNVAAGSAALACLLAGTTLVGCGAEQEVEVVERAYVPPPADVPPPVKSIEQLMAELRIDERVVLPEDQAPGTTEARKAVLELFDGFARGDSRAVGELLSDLDRRELDALVEAGTWDQTTDGITRIEVQTGPGPEATAVLALFDVAGDFQVQLWYLHEQDLIFEAAPTPPGIIGRLSGTDWIAAWHEILAEEWALAERPDEPIDLPRREVEQEDDHRAPGAGGSGPGFLPPPSAPPPPVRRPPAPRRFD